MIKHEKDHSSYYYAYDREVRLLRPEVNILGVDPERALRLCKRLLHLLPSLFQLIIVIMITMIKIIMMMKIMIINEDSQC